MQPPNQPSGPPPTSKQTPDEAAAEARRPAPRIDASRLWTGGIMTAAFAGLTAVSTVLLVRGLMGIPVLAADGHGSHEDASTGLLAAGSAVLALTATAVLHLLMLSTARPRRFFAWIIALSTTGMVLMPFTTTVSTEAKVGTGAVRLAIGVVIGTLLSAVCRGAGRRAV
ncbi:DUF6069 family protein [Streptomyces cadmiisoli]|uniref:DUF6069 family protein n=1 Tax=Streptomyces cadmiisoli TaxID=2184053 RepID=UPI0018EFE829|nr:DUF6069 family protein [Streptomyces cadmiisoli]